MNRQWTISIIVPVYKGGTEFRRCLAALARLQPAPLEIIVVSDGDAASSKVAAEFNVHVIQLPQREGPAHARNMGAGHARGDLLFFIDADVEVPPHLLHRLSDAFNAPHHATAVIGSYDSAPAAPGLVSQYKNLAHHYVHQHSEEKAATFWGACGAVRRDVFSLLGGFDEGYRRPCVEDIEFGYRLHAAQYSIRLIKSLQVKHLKQWSVSSLLKSDILDRGAPWTELILHYRQFNNDLNLRHSDRISVLLTWLLGVTVVMGTIIPYLHVATVLIMVLLFLLNASFYKFLAAQRGMAFAAAGVGLHWLSLMYSGAAFVIGAVRYTGSSLSRFLLRQVRTSKSPSSNRHINSLLSGSGGSPGGGA